MLCRRVHLSSAVCVGVLLLLTTPLLYGDEVAGHSQLHLEWDQWDSVNAGSSVHCDAYAETQCIHYGDFVSDSWPENGLTNGASAHATTPHGDVYAGAGGASSECPDHPGYYLLDYASVQAAVDCGVGGASSNGSASDYSALAGYEGAAVTTEVRACFDVVVPDEPGSYASLAVALWGDDGTPSDTGLLIWEKEGWYEYNAGNETTPWWVLRKDFGPGTNVQEVTTWTLTYLPDAGVRFESASSLVVTPEPASIAMLALGGLALIRRRRA